MLNTKIEFDRSNALMFHVSVHIQLRLHCVSSQVCSLTTICSIWAEMRPTSLTTATAKAKVRLHGTYLTFHYTKDVNALSTRGNVVAGFCVCCAPITELCVCVCVSREHSRSGHHRRVCKCSCHGAGGCGQQLHFLPEEEAVLQYSA